MRFQNDKSFTICPTIWVFHCRNSMISPAALAARGHTVERLDRSEIASRGVVWVCSFVTTPAHGRCATRRSHDNIAVFLAHSGVTQSQDDSGVRVTQRIRGHQRLSRNPPGRAGQTEEIVSVVMDDSGYWSKLSLLSVRARGRARWIRAMNVRVRGGIREGGGHHSPAVPCASAWVSGLARRTAGAGLFQCISPCS